MSLVGVNISLPIDGNSVSYIVSGYVTCILDDAKVYANHAKKKSIDVEDVKLATQMVLDKAFTSPPPRELLLELAKGKNMTPLPVIKPNCGLRLPPDRHCLINCNYKLRALTQPKKVKKLQNCVERLLNFFPNCR